MLCVDWFSNLLEEGDVRHEVLKRDLGILVKLNMAIVPTEVVVSMCTVVAQKFTLFRMVVLEPVEPAAVVLVVADPEQLHAVILNSVGFERCRIS